MTNEEIAEQFTSTMCRLAVYSTASFNLLAGIHIIQDERAETMGVRVHDGQADLVYNPTFAASLNEGERSYVMIHETLHILLHHCTFRSSTVPARRAKENIAMDLAVNSLITEGLGVSIPRFKEDAYGKKAGDVMVLLPSQFDYEPNLSFEQYLDLLDKDYPDNEITFVYSGNDGEKSDGDGNGNGKGNGNGNADGQEIDPDSKLGKIVSGRISNDHGEGYEEDSYLDDFIRDFVETTERNNSWGDMFGNSSEIIKRAQEPALRWENILRVGLGNFLTYEKVATRRRWNRHYGKPFLGTTLKCTEPVAVYADTSGSVNEHWLSRFVTEIERISYYTTTFLWSFDTIVQNPNERVMFSRRHIESIKFHGRGGTDYDMIFEHARANGMHHLVILTDGYASEVTEDQTAGMDVIWVITKGGSTNGKPGKIVQME